MMERKAETKLIKDLLAKAGYHDIRVSHGHGTAWGWVDIKVSMVRPDNCTCDLKDDNRYPYYCNVCRDALTKERDTVTKLVVEGTGRRWGDYQGNTLVDIEMVEKPVNIEPVKVEPIPYTTRETRRDIRANRAARANDRITKRNGKPMYY
jgi:hypothetical protein